MKESGGRRPRRAFSRVLKRLREQGATALKNPIVLVLSGMAMGQVNNFLEISSGMLEEVDAVTAFCVINIVGSVVLWAKARPNLKLVGWAVWWRVLLFAPLAVVAGVADEKAVRLLPMATVTALSLFVGPHLSAAFGILRERKRWRDLIWLGLSLGGVLMLSTPGRANLEGLLLIAVTGVVYHLGQKFRTDLKRMEGEKPDEKSVLNIYSAILRVPVTIYSLLLLFVHGEGVKDVTDMGWKYFLLCVWFGGALSVNMWLKNRAWDYGLRAESESMLAPLRPALTAVAGALAGQTLTLPECMGVALIVISGIGGARSDLRRRN